MNSQEQALLADTLGDVRRWSNIAAALLQKGNHEIPPDVRELLVEIAEVKV